jgi:carboxylate-amine ligase
MDGKLIDFRAGGELVEAREALERVLGWTEPSRARLGLDVALPARNGAQRVREAIDAGASIEEIYADSVRETERTYRRAGQALKPA